MRIGEMLKAWREKRDLQQRDLAKMLDIDPSTLSRVEDGASPNGNTLRAILSFALSDSQEKSVDDNLRKQPPVQHKRS